MKMKNILFWFSSEFTHFSMSYYLQKKNNFEFYAIIDVPEKTERFFQNQNFIKLSEIWFLHEFLNVNEKKPDIEFLKSVELKYGIDLWKIAINERQFYRFFEFHKFSQNEILVLLEKEIKFFEKVLETTKPDFFITKEPSRHTVELLCQMCKAKGIKVLSLSNPKIAYRCMITENSSKFDIMTDLSQIDSEIKSTDELENYIKSHNAVKQIGNYEKKHGESKLNLIKSGIKYLFFNNNKNVKTHYNYFGRTKLKVLFYMINITIKKKFRKRFIEKKLVKHVNLNTSFIYFSLGVDMERNILIGAPYYTNQIEVIRHLSKSIPINFKLYVKENPAQSSREWRTISEYKEMLNIPNVTLIHPDVDSKELIKKCSALVTINGSSGLEATFFGKPSIIFSDTVYSILPSVFRVNDIEKLPEIIREALNAKISTKYISRFIKLIEENSFEFDWFTLGSKFKEKFYFDGGLVDVNIDSLKMKEFLIENKSELTKLADEHLKKIEFFINKRVVR